MKIATSNNVEEFQKYHMEQKKSEKENCETVFIKFKNQGKQTHEGKDSGYLEKREFTEIHSYDLCIFFNMLC